MRVNDNDSLLDREDELMVTTNYYIEILYRLLQFNNVTTKDHYPLLFID